MAHAGSRLLFPRWKDEEKLAFPIVALPLGRRKLTRTWGVLHRHGRRLNLAEEQFIALCRNAGAKLAVASPETSDTQAA